MNYQTNIKQSFSYNLTYSAYQTNVYFSDGSGANFVDIELDNDVFTYLGQVANRCNREYSDRGTLMACEYTSYNNGWVTYTFLNSKVDYIVHGGGYIYRGLHLDNSPNTTLSDLIGYRNYPVQSQNGYFSFSEFTYDYYVGQVNETYSVYDLSNFKYETGSYLTDTTVIPGENVSFSNNILLKTDYSQLGCYLAYGSPLSDAYNDGFTSGYSGGYSTGLVNGIEQGYQQGLSAGGGNIGSQSATAFSFIGSAFNAAGGVLSIEVLPNITLGTCFAIPMVFVLIITIFKLVRK